MLHTSTCYYLSVCQITYKYVDLFLCDGAKKHTNLYRIHTHITISNKIYYSFLKCVLKNLNSKVLYCNSDDLYILLCSMSMTIIPKPYYI